MSPEQLSTLLISLVVLSFVFLAIAYYLSKNADHIKFWLRFTENKRQRKTNSFLAALVSQPDNSRVWGTDHSHWDGNVNFAITRARGASFTIIKCSEGTVPTRYYHENTVAARNAGLVVGAYHWLHRNSNVSCAAQAKVAWDRIKGYPNQLPLMVDFEWTRYNGMAANPSYIDLELFVDEFIRLSGRKPCMYSAPGYLSPLGAIPRRLRDKLAYIVIASYYVETPSYPDWMFHQFTDLGDAESLAPTDSGKKETDLIYFKGDLSALYRLAGLSAPPEPMPDPEEPMTQYKLLFATNERTSPSAASTLNLTGMVYPAGTIVDVISKTADSVFEQWGQLNNGRWVALIYNGNVRAELVPVTPPAPVPAGEIRLKEFTLTIVIDGREYRKTMVVDVPLDAVG
jgi:lysozyme